MSGIDRRDVEDAVFNVLSEHIQRTSRDNEFRDMYWKMMSERNWANNEFDRLVNEVTDFVYLIESSYSANTRFDTVVTDAVEKWVMMDLADLVLSDRDIQLDRRMERDLQELAHERAGYIREMKRLADEERRGSRDRRDSRDSRVPSRGSAGAPGRSSGWGRGSRDDDRESTRTTGFGGRGRRVEEPRASRSEEREEPLVRGRTGRTVSDQVDEPVRETRTTRAEPVLKPSTIEGPDFTLARPYDQFWIAGECWRPAYQVEGDSKWSLVPNKGEAFALFGTAYDPRKKMRFLVLNPKENTVREELKDMSRDSDYLRHELNSRQNQTRRHTSNDNPRLVQTEGTAFVAPGTLKEEALAILRASNGACTPIGDRIIMTGSREDAETVAQFAHMRANGRNGVSVLSYNITTPVMVTDNTNIELLYDVGGSINLTDASERMRACKDKVDPGAWEFVNERLSKLVTDVARNRFGIAVTLHNFADSYPALVDHLRKKDEVMTQKFALYTRYIPSKCCAMMSAEDARTWLIDTLGISEADFDAQKPTVLCYENYVTVGVVDFTLGDMGVLITNKPQRLASLDYPHLYNLLERLLETADTSSGGVSVTTYVLTRDRYRVEVIRNPLDESELFVRLMDDK